MKYSYILLLVFGLMASCQNDKNDQSDQMDAQSADTIESIQVTPFSPSVQYADASIESMTFENGVFNFEIGGETYQLGQQTPDAPQKMCANSAEGQHIHLIVDDQPYAAKYLPSFDYEIEDGSHYLLAFLSRSYHESIKTQEAHVAIKASIQNNSISDSEPVTSPMLFYSRPKGSYVGKDTEKVMLDFYLVNCELGGEYMVKADINGESFDINAWMPYYITGLPMGETTVTLTLTDKDGNAVDGPLNPVSRTITLAEDPADNQ